MIKYIMQPGILNPMQPYEFERPNVKSISFWTNEKDSVGKIMK